MAVDEDLVSTLIRASGLKYGMNVGDKKFILENVSIEKSKIPVRKPTTRGGVYFADTTAYKIKAVTSDLSILALLPKIMLGPNAEFAPIEVRTEVIIDNQRKYVVFVSHLANTVNTKNSVMLNLIVDKTVCG